MIVSTSHRVPPITNMSITTALIEKASSNQCDMLSIAAKVTCCTILPFLAIATFEALVINSLRIIKHCVTVLTRAPSPRYEKVIEQGQTELPRPQETLEKKEWQSTAKQNATILEIIQTVAETHAPFLFFKKSHLYELKTKIDSVHPLKFLSVILQHRKGKDYLRSILASPLKQWTFMGDLSSNLTTELENKTLYCYLDDFAKDVKIPTENLRPLIEARNWQGFIETLIA